MNTFRIEVLVLDGDIEVPEDQVVEYAAKAPEKFQRYLDLDGFATFFNGEEQIAIQDHLACLLPTLALETIPELLETGKSELVLFTSPENFALTTDG